eukprot:gene32775-39624_t
MDFTTNIGNVRSEIYRAYGPIDVVYTWVNGSDPKWLAKKDYWASKYFPVEVKNVSAEGNESTDVFASNRYRDSDELRYSIRSLVKFAPWVRHIYLVTDNQIPNWLNMETDKLTVISHTDIFANASHLPVFSSPAIEANIHRIKGLSEYFIYFNDDVFLGAPVLPEDFMTIGGAFRFVFAWEVPKCAPGCADSWIGDGYCDKACNVSECNFDFPDCINGTNVAGSAYTQAYQNTYYSTQCSTGCPDSWLGDKICDLKCNNAECGFDVGDCGLSLVQEHFPAGHASPANTRWGSAEATPAAAEEPERARSNATQQPREYEMDAEEASFYYAEGPSGAYAAWAKDEGPGLPPVASVPWDAGALHVNLSALFRDFEERARRNITADPSAVSRNATVEAKYSALEVEEEELLEGASAAKVHYAALLSKHHTLVLLLRPHSVGEGPA